MSTADIREKLHQYIENANDKKIKAIYTMVGEDIDARATGVLYDEAFIEEMERRNAEIENGSAKTYTWKEVKQRAKKSLQKARANQ